MNINIVSELLSVYLLIFKYFRKYLERDDISYYNRIQCINTVLTTLQVFILLLLFRELVKHYQLMKHHI